MRQAALRELARRELEQRAKEREPSLLEQVAQLPNRAVNYAQDLSRYAQRQFVGDGSAGGLIGARVYRGLNPFLSRDTSLEENENAQRGALQLEDSLGPTGAALAQLGAEMLPMAAITGASGHIGRQPVLAELSLSQATTPFAAIAQAAPKLLPAILRTGAANAAQNAATAALGSPEGTRLEVGARTLVDPQNLLLSFGPALLSLGVPGEMQYRASRAAASKLSPELPPGREPLLPVETLTQRNAIQEAGGLTPEPRTIRYAEDPMNLPRRELEQYVNASADDIAAGFKTIPGRPAFRGEPETQVVPIDVLRSEFPQIEAARDRTLVVGGRTTGTDPKMAVLPGPKTNPGTPSALAEATLPSRMETVVEPALADTVIRSGEGRTTPGTSADIAKLGIGPGGSGTEQVRLAQFARDYRLKTGRDPSPTELANALNITKPHAEKLLKYLGRAEGPELAPEPVLPAQGETLKQRLARARSQMLSGTSVAEAPSPQTAPRTLPTSAPVDHPEIARQAQLASQQARALRREGFFAGVRKGFLAAQFRAEAPYAAAGIRSYEAANAIANRQMGRVYPIVRRVMRALDAGGQNIVRKFIQQSIAPVKGQQVVPLEALPREVQSLFKAGIEQMKGQRNDLVKAGYFTPEQAAKMGEMDAQGIPWLHRDYLAYVDGKYVPKVENFERAMSWLARKNGKTPSEARAILLDMLSGEGTMEQRYRKATLNAGIGKARENIPPEIRRFLGQIDDPSFVFSSSMAEVERLWRQYRTTQALTAPDLQGKVWAPSFQEGMHPSPIPNQKRLYGEFAGKYVTPELYETVMQAPGATQPDLVQRFLIPLNSIFKTAKVGLNPVRYLSNWTSNALYSAAAGLPIWHWRWAPRMTQSARSMLAWGDSFLTPKAQGKTPNPGKDAAWMQWALEDGALPPGVGEEFGGSTAKAIARRFLQEKGSGPVEWMKHGWDSLRVAKARLGEIYDAVDQHWRLAVYIEQVTKGTDNLKLPLPEARARAAQIVNENFASGGTVGPGVKKLARNVGLVSPFMTFHSDNLRVHYNWLRDSLNLGGLKGGINSGQGSARALNVALQYALIGGLFEGMRRLSGFSDDDVRQAEAMLNTSYAKRNPIREWLPGRDAKNRARVVSLGPALFPTDVLLKGEGDSFLKRVMVNTVKGYFDTGALEYPLQSVLEAAGVEDPEYRPPSVRPGMEGRALLEQAWNMVEPAAFQTARNIARRTGMAGTLRQNEEPLTPWQAAMQLTPFKVEPVGPRSSEGNRIRSQAQAGSAERSQNTGRLAVSPEEKKRLQDAAKAEQDRRRRLQEERIRALQKR